MRDRQLPFSSAAMSRVLIVLLTLPWLCAAASARAGDAAPAPVTAAPLVFEYRIEHPLYGDVGTYINKIIKSGDTTEVLTSVRVSVKIFGAELYHEISDRTEHWRDGRLVGFNSVTDKDGKTYDVTGKAEGNTFAITGPAGTFTGPADVQPPNPWSVDCLKSTAMLSSMSGRIFAARIVAQGTDMLSIDGQRYRTQKYEIDTDRPHTVWFNNAGVPLQIESDEDGQPVRLVLMHDPEHAKAMATVPQP
jgi:uncharacterized protein DUF6134